MAAVQGSDTTPPAPGGRKTTWIVFAVVGGIFLSLVAVVVFVVLAFNNIVNVPIISGYPERSLDENIQVVKANASAEERGDAIEQIAKLGPEAQPAVPVLLEALRDDRKFRYRVMNQYAIHEKAADALVKIGGPSVVKGLTKLLADKDNKMIVRAATTLSRLGTGAEPAVPALLDAWEKASDPKVDNELSGVLVKIGGPKVISGLSAYLKDSDDMLVYRAGYALAQLGPEARDKAVPALSALLTKRTDEPMQSNLRNLLASINTPAAQAAIAKLDAQLNVPGQVKALQAQLTDAEPSVRVEAATKLGALGPSAKNAKEALVKALDDKDKLVRLEAAWALWLIVHDAKETFPMIVQSLGDERADVQLAARKRLDQIGPKDLWAADPLLENLGEKDKQLRFESLKALGQMGPELSKANKIDLLYGRQIDSDDEFRKEVLKITKKLPNIKVE